MNLVKAFLILSAFSSSFLLALLLYTSLIVNLPSSQKQQTKSLLLVQADNELPPDQQVMAAVPHPPSGKRQSLDFNCPTTEFPFRSAFSFPQPPIMKSLLEIDSSRFLCDLRKHLSGYASDKPLALITSNNEYLDVLLNWLISATVRSGLPLDTILVLSLDSTLQRQLTSRGIPSVYIASSMLFHPDVTFQKKFEEIMMLRLAVIRIVNHFGFDVVVYDTDAIMLKDPQPLYDELPGDDIIGSVGKIPADLAAEWGITICIGVVLVKSSSRTETYWNSMKDICADVIDDQGLLNCGLKALDVQWTNSDSDYQHTTVHGNCRNGLRVSILQYDYICRQTTCNPDKRSSYYIWHKGGHRSRKEKLGGAKDGRAWFLKHRWQFVTNNLRGVEWLESICYPGVTHE